MTRRPLLLAGILIACLALPAGAATRTAPPAAKPKMVPPAAARVDARGRTLEDIHIEGEIPVPQILFITTRDQRRFMEFQHHRYLRSSRTLGEDTALPSRIVVTRTPPDVRKETPR